MATHPASEHMFMVENYSAIETIRSQLRNHLCVTSLCPNNQIMKNPLLVYENAYSDNNIGNQALADYETNYIRGFDMLLNFQDYIDDTDWFIFSEPSKWFLKQAYHIQEQPGMKTSYAFANGLPQSFILKIIFKFDRTMKRKLRAINLFSVYDEDKQKQLAVGINPRSRFGWLSFYLVF